MQPAVIAVGRMNPPTRGHAVLVKRVKEEAKRLNARPILFIVDGEKSGQDKAKNPLTGEQREAYAKRLFPGVQVDVVSSAYQVLDVLYVQGYEPAVWIAGSDRSRNYQRMLEGASLTGKVVEVDRDAGEADGVSATAAREAALAGDWEGFKALTPVGASDELIADMMKNIREANHARHAESNYSSASSV
jgi:citrate lyase synthetase